MLKWGIAHIMFLASFACLQITIDMANYNLSNNLFIPSQLLNDGVEGSA